MLEWKLHQSSTFLDNHVVAQLVSMHSLLCAYQPSQQTPPAPQEFDHVYLVLFQEHRQLNQLQKYMNQSGFVAHRFS